MCTGFSLPRAVVVRPARSSRHAAHQLEPMTVGVIVLLVSAAVVFAPIAPPALRPIPCIAAAVMSVLGVGAVAAGMEHGARCARRGVGWLLGSAAMVTIDALATWLLGGA